MPYNIGVAKLSRTCVQLDYGKTSPWWEDASDSQENFKFNNELTSPFVDMLLYIPWVGLFVLRTN